MIEIKLLESNLKKIIEDLFKNEEFPVYKSDETRKINVITGFLPPEQAEETIIPAIAIRTLKGKNTLDKKQINTKIIIGIFDKNSETGYEKLYEMTELVFTTLIEKGTIADRFEILTETDWNIPEGQPYPFWISEIIINVLYEKNYRTDADDWVMGGNK